MRVTIIAGHYGSGKTTFAINYGIYLSKKTNSHIYLADLDVVNPYFRSREHKEELKKYNIDLLGTYIYTKGSDLPAVSGDVFSIFANKNSLGIIDLGGNAVGAMSFGNFKDRVDKSETDLFFVLNASRLETSTLEGALEHMTKIEYTVDMKISGIIHNTHFMEYTTYNDIIEGEKLAKEVSAARNIPVIYSCVERRIYNENDNSKLNYKPFILDFDIKSQGI